MMALVKMDTLTAVGYKVASIRLVKMTILRKELNSNFSIKRVTRFC
jgi:hypothetical protein